jgi:hypothetical protein
MANGTAQSRAKLMMFGSVSKAVLGIIPVSGMEAVYSFQLSVFSWRCAKLAGASGIWQLTSENRQLKTGN